MGWTQLWATLADHALSRAKVGIADLRRSLLNADILCFSEKNLMEQFEHRDIGPDFLDNML